MAGPTPQVNMSLGPELLEQIGDLKGAAKAMGGEARSAKKEAKDAEKSLKDLQKQQKINEKQAENLKKGLGGLTAADRKTTEVEIEKLLDSTALKKANAEAIAKQTSLDRKTVDIDRLKEASKAKAQADKELKEGLGFIDKRVSGKLQKTKDALDGVGGFLMREGAGDASFKAGKAILSSSKILSGETAAAIGGKLSSLAVAAAPAAVAAGVLLEGFDIAKQIYGNKEVAASIRNQSEQVFLDFVRDFTVAKVDPEFLLQVNAAREEAKRSSMELAERFTGMESDGTLATWIGFNKKQAEISRVLQQEVIENQSLLAKHGAEFVSKIQIKDLMKEQPVILAAEKRITKEDTTIEALKRAYLKYTPEGLLLKAIFGEDKPQAAFGLKTTGESLFEEAAKRRAGIVKGKELEIAEVTRQASLNPVNIAERKIRANNIHAAERKRRSDAMAPATF